MIAKRADAPYAPGRSGDWLKFKRVNQQEFVIGGYTDPKGSRQGLGALLLGYWQGDDLVYAGKVGTGFDQEMLAELRRRLAPLERARATKPTTPSVPPAPRVPPAATPLGLAMLRAGCRWFKDWYFPEGGREGGTKLPGTLPLDEQRQSQAEEELAAELHAFLDRDDAEEADAARAREALGLLGG